MNSVLSNVRLSIIVLHIHIHTINDVLLQWFYSFHDTYDSIIKTVDCVCCNYIHEFINISNVYKYKKSMLLLRIKSCSKTRRRKRILINF